MTKLNSGPKPRTVIWLPSPLARDTDTPVIRCNDSARLVSGNLPISSAVIASTTPLESRFKALELIGGGMSSDAYHMTAPHPEGIGVERVMHNCLNDAGIQAGEVDAINTHGTSTPLGDVAELKAISKVFGAHANKININSTKSMTGHLLGAAGAIEAIASILSMQHNLVPPTINHNQVDPNIDPSLNLTLNKAQEREVNIAMSNTFGFGGHNACVLFRKLKE